MLFARFENVSSWGAVAVGTSATAITPSPAYARTALHLTNTSPTQTVFVGYSDAVTASHYVKRLAPGEFFEIQAGPSVALHAIGSAPGATLSVAEVA